MQGQVQFCHNENKPVIYVKDLLSCVILCSSIKPTFVTSSRPLFKFRQLHQTHTKESTDANKNYDPVLNLSASLYLHGTRKNRLQQDLGTAPMPCYWIYRQTKSFVQNNQFLLDKGVSSIFTNIRS